ncbi:WD40 repeat-like protein [Nadsonia fulvescens var. elongata DSM 6958]|uniref:WD40 repeat-like protein n=1 Tax=Nadsonia fulvescens var. elongata DSM 6958 TaxID=857566 RepID=A0A1E3PUT4_9ASCO|nr:WD40 repeat-like protein [Nadsonia fulvescens var. elongata DSM 6958]
MAVCIDPCVVFKTKRAKKRPSVTDSFFETTSGHSNLSKLSSYSDSSYISSLSASATSSFSIPSSVSTPACPLELSALSISSNIGHTHSLDLAENSTSVKRQRMSPPISYETDIPSTLDKGKIKDTAAPATSTALNSGSTMTTPTIPDSYFGLDRTEVTRLLIRTLQELGYDASAVHLSASSQLSVDNSQIAAFRDAISQGNWDFTVSLLDQLQFQPRTSPDYLIFLIRRQEFLEYLENGSVPEALRVLTDEITPLKISRLNELHKLSSYLMYNSLDELRIDANWDGVANGGRSRMNLFESLQGFISPKLLIPNHRLITLLNQAKQYQIERASYELVTDPFDFTLYKDYSGPETLLPLRLLSANSGSFSSTTPLSIASSDTETTISQGHKDEVWYVAFSHNGRYLASSSKDGTVIIWEVDLPTRQNSSNPSIPNEARFRVLGHLEGHTAGVSKVEWSPQDDKLLTCSKDKTAKVWDRASMTCILTTDAHGHSVHTGSWLPNGQQFITASPGGDTEKNMILWNLENGGQLVLSWSGLRVFDVAITPDGNNLVCICSAKRIHFFSLRCATDNCKDETAKDILANGIQKAGPAAKRLVVNSIKLGDTYIGGNKIDSIVGTMDPRYVLVHVSPSQIQLWDIELQIKVQVYQRPKQGNNVLRCRAFGPRDNFIISGGADGEIYVWNRSNSRLVGKFPAHDGTVNCIDSKFYPETNLHLFASGGDDSMVKLWTVPG